MVRQNLIVREILLSLKNPVEGLSTIKGWHVKLRKLDSVQRRKLMVLGRWRRWESRRQLAELMLEVSNSEGEGSGDNLTVLFKDGVQLSHAFGEAEHNLLKGLIGFGRHGGGDESTSDRVSNNVFFPI
ncbi:UNVERIFIED_CONTAM: hypothetical protein Sradi_2346700 [Sesamum radiatum]|uniref:Uncharacterized protein n=1 Tax=Sesamum radiatum TaxID=300843 RepID=A0AAW2T5P1_SESRA